MIQDNNQNFSAFSGPNGKPTEAERKLIEAMRSGVGAFCEELADEEKLVSVALIEALAMGTFSHADWKNWQQHPYGLWLRGAIVEERLHLENRNVPIKLSFDGCEFRQGFDFDGLVVNGALFLRRCKLAGECRMVSAVITGQFSASDATFENPEGKALSAQDVKAEGWFINDIAVKGCFDFNGAQIAGQINANNSRFEAGDVAVQAFGVKAGSWVMQSAQVQGRFEVNGAIIHDSFIANQTRFSNPGGDAIWAQRVRAGTWMMHGAIVEGRLDIHEADIGGQLGANAARFENPGKVAIWAQGVRTAGWFMDEATVNGCFDINSANLNGQFSANGARFGGGQAAILAYNVHAAGWFMNKAAVNGPFYINNADINGHFSAEEALFEHPAEALVASGAKATTWSLTATTVKGPVSLYGANISGYFSAMGATFENVQGPAFDAQFATFGGGVFLREGTSVIGDVDFAGATVCKVLDLSNASFSAVRHIAVRLQETHVTGDTTLMSSKFLGIVDGTRAKFDGRLSLKSSELIAPSIASQDNLLTDQVDNWANAQTRQMIHGLRHHALLLNEARVGGRLVLSRIPARGIVDLSHARCAVLEDHAAAWPAPIDYKQRGTPGRLYATEDGTKTDAQHIVLDGFEYGYFEFPDGSGSSEDQRSNKDVAEARVDWLAAQSADDLTERFNPQPWRQASSVLRSMGYDRASQIISIERRVRERYARDMPKRQKFVSWLLHLVADYGFNPWKTVMISVGVVLLWAAVYWAGTTLCGDPNSRVAGQCSGQPLFVAVQLGDVDDRFVDSGGYPAFGHIAYSLDAFVPLFDFGTETYWRPNARAWADVTLDWPVFEHPPTLKVPLGYILHWLFIIERFLGAILIAIAVTGFTGLLTRDEK